MTSPLDSLINLISLQRKEVPDIGLYGKLDFEDIKRIDRCISGDPLKSTKCCLYLRKLVKNSYATFSFRGKKTSILRMLYHNYKDNIKHNSKIIHTCENKGLCCNLNHFKVVDGEEAPENEKNIEKNEETTEKTEIFDFDEEIDLE